MRKGFQIKQYQLYSKKIKEDSEKIRICMLSDLHAREFGNENSFLVQAIAESAPDLVLLAGDMILKYEKDSLKPVEKFISDLSKRFPVYYARGNHEKKMRMTQETAEAYLQYEQRLRETGCHILADSSEVFCHKGLLIHIYGLDLALDYYYNPKCRSLPLGEITQRLGKPHGEDLNLLLAHHPGYGDSYFQWGADLIFSGHYHGGIVRFGENQGLVSTNLQFFPKYCCGLFRKGWQYMAVSPGMGEHTLPLRVCNPRQLFLIEVHPVKPEEKTTAKSVQ